MKRFARCGLAPLLLAAATALWADTGQARGELFIALNGSPTLQTDGNFLYTYNVELNPGFSLQPNSSNLLTVYDIPGYVPGTAKSTMTGFATTGTDQLLGVTPAGVNPVPPDNPSLLNTTFQFTGPGVSNPPSAPGNLPLGTFSFESTIGAVDSTRTLQVADQAEKPDVAPFTDVFQDQKVFGPQANPIPAPGGLVLLGSGVPLLAAAAAFRRRLKLLLTLA